jgi:hypothetical protein
MASTSGHGRRTWLKGALLAAGGARAGLASAGTADGRPALLMSLLARNHRMHPEYNGALSNHCSMGLFSLAALGGTAAQLQGFADSQWPRLDPLGAPPAFAPLTPESWTGQLGKRDAHGAFLDLFRREVAGRGREATLRRYLPALMPGLGTGAFHALIRTAYGARFGNDDEVVDGLAYWAIAFAPLGPLPAPGAEAEPLAVLKKVHDTPALAGQRVAGELIIGKMKTAARLPDFAAAVGALRADDRTLGRLAGATLRLYAATRDFTALHAVTGTHACRQVLPYTDPVLAARYLWQAVLAAYITIRAPAVPAPAAAEPPAWDALARRAATSRDEHDLKLVEIARDEDAHYGDPLYRHAADARLRET